MDAGFSLALFLVAVIAIMAGFPVAFTLGGTALFFALIGTLAGSFDTAFLHALPNRLFGIMTNPTLVAVPVFVFMGAMLERSGIATDLLQNIGRLFRRVPGGLGVGVLLVGMLLAASTGIVGATVVTMGLLSLPTMLRQGYDPRLACGTICAAGTLGQIIPPSIVLVLLGDVLSNAFQRAQLQQGIFSPQTVSVGDLFVGALLPGLLLVGLYMVWIVLLAWRRPQLAPAVRDDGEPISTASALGSSLPPLLLIMAVLGSIMAGLATPTEAASVGAMGALLLAALRGRLSRDNLHAVMDSTVRVTSMVFLILIGAALFSLVFRGFGGDQVVHAALSDLPGGVVGTMAVVMLVMFLLGFVLDFIEITFVVVPMVAPVLLEMGLSPVWLGIMLAINLQTSFLTPPFGFALFYLRGVAPKEVTTGAIYAGVAPFVVIQLLALAALALWPGLATWLPGVVYR